MSARAGDVVRYRSQRENRWCREEIAIVEERASGLFYLDTYWGLGSETHVLSDAEIATAEFIFNLDDFDELDKYARGTPSVWETYAPDDRQHITEQHGWRWRYFIRKGSSPDHATKVANARLSLEKAEQEAASAASRVEWEREELARLEAETIDT